MQKIYIAGHRGKVGGAPWGTGTPWREFLHVDDMAEASPFVLHLPRDVYEANTQPMLSHINLGSSTDIAILALAHMVAEVTGLRGSISTDPTEPDATLRKLMDVSRLATIGRQARIGLREGGEQTYAWHCAQEDRRH